jgi:hypothetical protein
LLESAACTAPFATGFVSPVIVMPRGFAAWPAALTRSVIGHELAHISRHDTWWRALGELAIALHWGNPLVWLVARAGVTTSECAADDRVVAIGVPPELYAGHLVTLSRTLRANQPLPAAIHMARSDLPARVLALLQVGIHPIPSRLSTRLCLATTVLFTTAAATMAPTAGRLAGAPSSTMNLSNGGPEISSNGAGLQARWFVEGRPVGAFITGPLDLRQIVETNAPSGPGSFEIIAERATGTITYSWPEDGIAPRWVRTALQTAPAQLAGLPRHGGATPAAPRGPGSRSTMEGLPALSEDPGQRVVQAGWIEGGYRYGVFARGGWTEDDGRVDSGDAPAWLWIFRYDPVDGRREVFSVLRGEARVAPAWVTESVRRINTMLASMESGIP